MNARGLALGLGILCLGLGGTLAWLLLRAAPPDPHPPRPSPEEAAARQEAIERLVAATKGTLDSHPDAQVAKLLLPSIKDGHDGKVELSSNRFGMRDVDWAVPKPANTVRVVLLGDSFIYGMGVPADQRVGVFLQKALAEHTGASPAPKIEVLHLGIVSWNIVSECAFLRRQIALLQPDLVIQHIVPNDLDDTHGVRGFGVDAKDSPLHPEQADAYVSFIYCRDALNPQARPLLPWANDFEARSRMDEAVGALVGLRAALAAQGCSYLVEVNWHSYLQAVGKSLAGKLPDDEQLFLPSAHYFNNDYRLSKADEHWNPAGHEEQARLLFGAIRGRAACCRRSSSVRGPRPRRTPPRPGRRATPRPSRRADLESRLARQNVTSSIDVGDWNVNTAGEVYTGVTADGLVSPFAILVLDRAGGARVHLTGAALPRPEMDGATLHVLVDAPRVGTQPLHSGQPFDFSAPLPASAGHDWLAVRLTTSDFVYEGADQRRCASFHLQRIAIEN